MNTRASKIAEMHGWHGDRHGSENAIHKIAALHGWYRSNVLDVRETPEWQRRWLAYLQQGYTLEDLQLVVKYLQREIRASRRNQGAILLRNLLEWGPDGQFLRFDEDLALAKAWRGPGRRVEDRERRAEDRAPRRAPQAQLDEYARRLREKFRPPKES